MLKISIPKPCHENWNEMLPQQQGRFCNACAKTVVDFTLMDDEEVRNYFIKNSGKKTCGRFISTQLQRITIQLPENILFVPMPYWKRFLTASLIIFSATLFSCDTNYNSKVPSMSSDKFAKPRSANSQQISYGNFVDGEVMMSKPNVTVVTTSFGKPDIDVVSPPVEDTPPVNNNASLPFLGKIKMPDSIPPKKVCTQTMGIVARPEKLMGDVMLVHPKADTAAKKNMEPIIGTSVVTDPKFIKEKILPGKTDTPKIKRDTFKLVGEIVIYKPKQLTKSQPDSCDKDIYQ